MYKTYRYVQHVYAMPNYFTGNQTGTSYMGKQGLT